MLDIASTATMENSSWNSSKEFQNFLTKSCHCLQCNHTYGVPLHCLEIRLIDFAEFLRMSLLGPDVPNMGAMRKSQSAALSALGVVLLAANSLCLRVFTRQVKAGVEVSGMRRCLVYGDMASLAVGAFWHVPFTEGLAWEETIFACQRPFFRFLARSVPFMAGCVLLTNFLLLLASRERLEALRLPLAYRSRVRRSAWRTLLPAALPSFAIGLVCFGELASYEPGATELRSLACRHPGYFAEACWSGGLQPLDDHARALPNLFFRGYGLCPYRRLVRSSLEADVVFAGTLLVLILGQLFYGARMAFAYRLYAAEKRKASRTAWDNGEAPAESRVVTLVVGGGVLCSLLLLLALATSALITGGFVSSALRPLSQVVITAAGVLQLVSNPLATFVLSKSFRAALKILLCR